MEKPRPIAATSFGRERKRGPEKLIKARLSKTEIKKERERTKYWRKSRGKQEQEGHELAIR